MFGCVDGNGVGSANNFEISDGICHVGNEVSWIVVKMKEDRALASLQHR